ncbi:class I SAM-dependent methyltransferase [Kribbella sp. ALI-6-A]|uniref:class I SAM-dependent methyltransferase n=1 Tax=Kribbella sp. ALI-6-A TaxID=1933817 RepID=UPI001EDBCDAC|nr:methyltransferase domain-containing protein [Kribbella sp. ALI-6-A]
MSTEEVVRARGGDWSIVLIGHEPVDRSWLPTDLTGKDVLCLASGDAAFDVVFHPVSNLFAPDLAPVWRECFRVLRSGGTLLAGFLNPDVYLFDHEALDERGELIVVHKLPYSDVTQYSAEERATKFGAEAPLEYSHTLTDQIGGQLAAGFVLTGFAEAPHHSNASADYLSHYFATRAVKPG